MASFIQNQRQSSMKIGRRVMSVEEHLTRPWDNAVGWPVPFYPTLTSQH